MKISKKYPHDVTTMAVVSSCMHLVTKHGLNYLIPCWQENVEMLDLEIHEGLMVDEYLNDVDARNIIDRILHVLPNNVRTAVEADLKPIDALFLKKTQETEMCIWGNENEQRHGWNHENQWYYYRAPEQLLSELKRTYWRLDNEIDSDELRFTRDPAWSFLSDGVSFYENKQHLKEDLNEITNAGYDVVQFDCSTWRSSEDMYADFAQKLRFPDYCGHNLDALDECLFAIDVPNETGLVLVFLNFDTPSFQHSVNWKKALIEILKDTSHKYLSIQRKMFTLVESQHEYS